MTWTCTSILLACSTQELMRYAWQCCCPCCAWQIHRGLCRRKQGLLTGASSVPSSLRMSELLLLPCHLQATVRLHVAITAKMLLHRYNSRLVLKIARGYAANKMVPYDDLVAAGFKGLDTALAKFDLSKGFALTTYAYNWICAAMQRVNEKTCSLVAVPINVQELARKLRSFRAQQLSMSNEEAMQVGCVWSSGSCYCQANHTVPVRLLNECATALWMECLWMQPVSQGVEPRQNCHHAMPQDASRLMLVVLTYVWALCAGVCRAQQRQLGEGAARSDADQVHGVSGGGGQARQLSRGAGLWW
jgi:hypothetical protein